MRGGGGGGGSTCGKHHSYVTVGQINIIGYAVAAALLPLPHALSHLFLALVMCHLR